MKQYLPLQIAACMLAFGLGAHQGRQEMAAYQDNRATDSKFYMSADFLYWKANQDGMAYGQIANFSANIPISPFTAQPFIGSLLNINFKFKPGVRLLLGFQPKDDSWDFNFIWTHLNTKATGASHNPDASGGPVVIPNYLFLVPQPLANNGINATASWSAHYNTFDLDTTKELSLCRSIDFQAHMGLRNIWLNQKYDILSLRTYTNDVPPAFVNAQSNMVQKMWGIGPMVGLSSQWNIRGGFNIFGQASFALLWTKVNSTNIGTILTEEPAVTINMLSAFHTMVPDISMAIGGQYDWIIKDDYHVCARLGWDFQTFFNTNFLGANYTSLGNFNLNGLTAGLALDF